MNRNEVRAPSLLKALRLGPSQCLALVGSGGKTTALFRIARLLEPPVLAAAATHMAQYQLGMADRHIIAVSPADLPAANSMDKAVWLFTGSMDGERSKGLDSAVLQRLRGLAEEQRLPLLVEADGSRQLPLKAPASHEPPIPSFVDLVVVVAGLSGIGQPLSPVYVHRPEIFARLSGLDLGSLITVEALARVLCSPEGGLKNIPTGARRAVFLNQADSPERQSQGWRLAELLLPSFDSVVVASLFDPLSGVGKSQTDIYSVHEQVAGIVLAAGGSSRFGKSKQLLPWEGEPLVRRAARSALEAGLSPVVVIAGEAHEQVKASLQGLDVLVLYNSAWQEGQSTSLQAGLKVLPANTGGAVFLLADQPHVPVELLRILVESHKRTLAAVTAPVVGGERGNPVLFDRETFKDLLALSGDVGGRGVIADLGPEALNLVPWDDASLLLDIDTPDDYQNLTARGRGIE